MRIRARLKRWLIVVALTLVIGVGVAWWMASRPTEWELKFERIQLGMSREQVTLILGPPTFDSGLGNDIISSPSSAPRKWMVWESDSEAILIHLHDNSIVAEKHYDRMTPMDNVRDCWQRVLGVRPPF
jgi:hypothetical protein